MSINFTGIKNIGAVEVIIPSNNCDMSILSMQLTDDEQGNDLEKFKKSFYKNQNLNDYLTAYDGALSINVSTNVKKEEDYLPNKYTFYVNGTELEVNDDNLPVFSYLAKLTGKIANKKDSEMGGDVNYIKSPNFLKGTSLGYFFKQYFYSNTNINIPDTLDQLFNPNLARYRAKMINNAINETMIDYLC